MVALAYADVANDSAANLQLVLISLLTVAGAALLAGVPVWGAWRRRHPHLEVIGAAMLIWTIALAWSSISLVAGRSDWEKEKTLRIESGYDSNPTDAGSPPLPIAFWSVLAAGWLLIDCWAFLMPTRFPSPPTPLGTLQPSQSQAASNTSPESNDLFSS